MINTMWMWYHWHTRVQKQHTLYFTNLFRSVHGIPMIKNVDLLTFPQNH